MNDNVLQTVDIDDLLLLYLVQGNTKKTRRVLVHKNLERWEELGESNACFLDAFV